MKISTISLSSAAAVLLAAVIVSVSMSAQAPQTGPGEQAPPAGGQPGGPPPPPRNWPAPTNLKVLPKNLTGQQVRDIMEKWEGELGGHCNTCHAADPNNVGPNGRPRLNFADDSKPEKATARLMFRMVEDINTNYVGKIDSSGMPVTCGTCHRGHVSPEPFVPAPEHEHHEGPPPSAPK